MLDTGGAELLVTAAPELSQHTAFFAHVVSREDIIQRAEEASYRVVTAAALDGQRPLPWRRQHPRRAESFGDALGEA